MQKSDCYLLGHITKTKGLKGEVIFFLDVDNAQEYQNLGSVFIELGKNLIPFFIQKIQVGNKSNATVKLEDVDHVDDAKDLVKKRLFLPLASLPELKDQQFYFHEVIGYTLKDINDPSFEAEIVQVLDLPNNTLFEAQYKDVLINIPCNDHFIKTVNKEEKWISLDIPEGLIDLLSDHSSSPKDE